MIGLGPFTEPFRIHVSSNESKSEVETRLKIEGEPVSVFGSLS